MQLKAESLECKHISSCYKRMNFCKFFRYFCRKQLFWTTKENQNASSTSSEMHSLQEKFVCVFKFENFITWYLTQKFLMVIGSQFLQH